MPRKERQPRVNIILSPWYRDVFMSEDERTRLCCAFNVKLMRIGQAVIFENMLNHWGKGDSWCVSTEIPRYFGKSAAQKLTAICLEFNCLEFALGFSSIRAKMVKLWAKNGGGLMANLRRISSSMSQ